MADKINAAGYETKPWWPYVRELMEGGGSVTVEQLNVTENGTYTAEAGKAYSPVVVNVEGGSSDFSTATVTITVNAGTGAGGLDGGISGNSGGDAFLVTNQNGAKSIATICGGVAGTSFTGEAILLKQPLAGNIYTATYLVRGLNPVVTGDCTLTEDEGEAYLEVTGDCTITVDPVS